MKTKILQHHYFILLILIIMVLTSSCGSKKEQIENIDSTEIDLPPYTETDTLSMDSSTFPELIFCCTNHNPKHCGRDEELEKLSKDFKCTF